MTRERDDIVALDSAILQHPQTWEATGHLAGFTDPMVDCRKCGQRFRADHVGELACPEKPSKHPGEAPNCDLTEARDFNLMFETTMGPVKDSGATVYLRPETAQGIFVNFKNVLQFSRKKPPFGIAQVGKSFRNEITPGNFIFRTREFEQMEMEFFVPPAKASQWYRSWKQLRFDWYGELGIRADHLRLREHDPDELSHYSSGTADVEYLFPIGWSELEGIANRGDFDLTQHAKFSARSSSTSTRRPRSATSRTSSSPPRARTARRWRSSSTPTTRRVGGELRTVLKLHPRLAPVKVAVLPLVRKDGQPEVAREIVAALRGRMQTEYDEGGSKASATAARTRSARRTRHGRPPVARRSHGDRARPRLARAGAHRRDGQTRRRAGRAARRAVAVAELRGRRIRVHLTSGWSEPVSPPRGAA